MDNQPKTPPFHLVWNPAGNAPRYQHPTKAAAKDEAERLARENPGHKFYVLCPVMVAVRNDVLIEHFETDGDGIPF